MKTYEKRSAVEDFFDKQQRRVKATLDAAVDRIRTARRELAEETAMLPLKECYGATRRHAAGPKRPSLSEWEGDRE